MRAMEQRADGQSDGRAARGVRYDRAMFALMNREEAKSMHATAARRRAVVGVHAVLSVVMVASWLAMVFDDRMWALVTMVVALFPWVLATGVLNSATRGLLELRRHVLDERQLAERDHVHARSHRLMTGVLLVAALGTGAAGWLGDLRVEALVAPVLISLLVLHFLLPLWVAGLRVEDEPGEENDSL
ncbi:hypothetical protein [Streptomyces sp. H27-C3]|uniref:hypothetical protein n=1 Tax=Streptomyces sp. H27-C3 TaxID=3046305 RepID=UPI0024BB5A39|nr:hypothetical protein [Streptomyces sp. H27-C3]MDJ0464057.1 hypothetical protein [Streptomyces sp. H27-C3]